ncbi:MAG: transcription-repair coupling factor [Peptococcaceae bacterium]|nr:transcription-repair coupling factor [Peptococcaceae bacterium]
MKGLLALLEKIEEFKEICRGIDNKDGQQMVFGLAGAQKAYVAAALIEHRQSSALILVSGDQDAVKIKDDLQSILPERRVCLFPALQLLPYQVLAAGWEIRAERIKVLDALINNEGPLIVIATPEAFIRRLAPVEAFVRHRVILEVGKKMSQDFLRGFLFTMGYELSQMVEGHGQFSIRGGIVDIFPLTLETPLRIEFFDDEIDSIRTFDVDSQRSIDKLTKFTVIPANELVIMTEDRVAGLEKIRAEFDSQLKKINKKGDLQAAKQLEETYYEVEEKISKGLYFPEIDHYLPYFHPDSATLLEYLAQDSLILMDEPGRWKESVDFIHQERTETFSSLLSSGKGLPGQYTGYLHWDRVLTCLEKKTVVFFSLLPGYVKNIIPDRVIAFPAKGIPAFLGRTDLFIQEIFHWKSTGYGIVIIADTREQSVELLSLMRDRGLDAYIADDLEASRIPGNILIFAGHISSGFQLPTVKLVVIASSEIYGRQRKIRSSVASKPKMEIMSSLKAGDYIVHLNHGVGRYLGIKELDIGGIRKDYLTIKYAGQDKLFVPTDQVGLIEKYLGGESEAPKLSKMGGAEWGRIKSRVKESVKEMAAELLTLYAARENLQGYSFSKDNVWQKEFEELFPYEETIDQIKAIEEVKVDMEKSRPMDRLLCGDVGYGKTEVALRAAFKAVMDSKQVAVLVPTTILAQQHYNTFIERFSAYPIRIEMLSRFRSPGEQKSIIKELGKGNLDIIIGTHRLVQGDVSFKDLGLVIVDEEQRFGVAHKEKLKLFKKNVDVLTLTATPIPRTLHMSLVGVRDTSLLETPPVNRFPVQTYVLEEEPTLIRESIYREISRGGQVFLVHNRVQDLERIVGWVQSLVPEARLAMAHGQMREDQLEQVMVEYIEGRIDVLICTTIIENGLDIPNVNTLIVKESNNMGLAQLYQLRGRVGRSDRIAYAYFTYPRERILSELAEKRLSAIKEFTAFGSGYKIALRDLEIRGAGNILGPEQHGFINAVGFDLYCRLLEDAVMEAKGLQSEMPEETTVELPVDAYIPADYIIDGNQKVEVYRKLANLKDPSLLEDLAEEMEDRFGDPPAPVQRLFQVAKIRTMAGLLRIKNISEQSGFFRLQLSLVHNFTGETLVRIGDKYKNRVKFVRQEDIFEIKFWKSQDSSNVGSYLKELEDLIRDLAEQ